MITKIKSWDEIEQISKNLREDGKTIVTTNGSFDILHYAHLNLIQKAKSEGDKLLVLLNSDESIKRAKGDKRPIVPERERARMLEGLEAVDYVVVFGEDKPLKLMGKIKPHIHVKGGSFDPDRVKEEVELMQSFGGVHKNFELEEGFSTSEIINNVLEKYSQD